MNALVAKLRGAGRRAVRDPAPRGRLPERAVLDDGAPGWAGQQLRQPQRRDRRHRQGARRPGRRDRQRPHARGSTSAARQIDGKLSRARRRSAALVTDIDLVSTTRRRTSRSKSAQQRDRPRRRARKDPAETALIAHYDAFAGPIANRVVGSVTAPLCRPVTAPTAAGEAPLGNVIADAQLEATAPTDFGGAVIAFMNPGGIRAPLNSVGRRPATSRTGSCSTSSRSATR